MPDDTLSFLSPKSIAIIGASKDPTKRGYQAIRYLIADKFPGGIYPIHPREPEILGIPAYASVTDVQDTIDIALVCTQAKTLPSIVEDLGKKGVKGAIILAGGFGEMGPEGEALERETLDKAKAYSIRLIGPNTSGIFNLHAAMNLVGMPDVRAGGIGIVSQSGNMALSIVTEASSRGYLGFSTYVGVGNQADVHFHEYLSYMGQDPDTFVPVLYVEGFKEGRAFLDVARDVTQHKPVVLYKSGRTSVGQESAKSHTGALAGSYEMTVDLMRQAGVTVARQSDHVVPVAEALRLLPPAASNRVAVLADGGGHATIAADSLTENGIELPRLSADTTQKLSELLPPAASLANPVDVAGGTDTNPGLFADCAQLSLEDPNVDALLIVGLFGGYKLRFAESLGHIENETAIRLSALVRRYNKPILLQSLYTFVQPDALKTLRGAGVPVQESIEIASSCMTALVHYGHAKRRNAEHPPIIVTEKPEGADNIVKTCRDEERLSLFEYEAIELLKAYGVQMENFQFVSTKDDLDAAYDVIGDMPKVMKVVSKDILHKTEAGGVRLALRDKVSVHKAFDQIMGSALAYDPGADIKGVLLGPMAEPGVEVIIGMMCDPVYGPVMMFGIGGTLVEVLRDVSFRAIPLSPADAEEMLAEIKSGAILEGVRGAPPIDKEAIVDVMMKVSALVQAHPEIVELDLNPIFAHQVGCTVVDARVILSEEPVA
ncbi:acetate--CoA ligase family protein [Magnetovibrio sp. PR-2]|uniref:acetate--CoA ligase family protein n=1 Tax=Magnetovibrio sp. PR-2 TaxID=3120356 RepID=UPI002FCDE500